MQVGTQRVPQPTNGLGDGLEHLELLVCPYVWRKLFIRHTQASCNRIPLASLARHNPLLLLRTSSFTSRWDSGALLFIGAHSVS